MIRRGRPKKQTQEPEAAPAADVAKSDPWEDPPEQTQAKSEQAPDVPQSLTPGTRFDAATIMLGYVMADAYPKERVPEKLQEIADKCGIPNPFDSETAAEVYPELLETPAHIGEQLAEDAEQTTGTIRFPAQLGIPRLSDKLTVSFIVSLAAGGSEDHAKLLPHHKELVDVIVLTRKQEPPAKKGRHRDTQALPI